MPHAALPRTSRSLTAGASVIGRADGGKTVRVTIHVKRSRDPENKLLPEFVGNVVSEKTSQRRHLTRPEYAAQFGTTASDMQKVRKFAREYGLRVVHDYVVQNTSANPLGHRTLELEGSIGALSKAFNVRLVRVRDSEGNIYRTYTGPLSIPEQYSDVIENVLGLDTRPQARPRFHPFPHLGGFDPRAATAGYYPNEVAKLYKFPTGVTGAGQTIAILELGGGFRRRDLNTYFRGLGIQMPSVKSVSIGGASNSPDGNPNGPDGEVMLDIEVVGAVAPGAKIVVYFAPNTNRGFFRAINAAVYDNRHKPTIISISWGGPESSWTLQDMNSIDAACQAAAAMGISVFCAAGDDGSTDGVPGLVAHVDFPASSPFVTACGGTQLVADSSNTTVVSEQVWNDGPGSGTGGGISEAFPTPVYQKGPAIFVPPSINPGGYVGRGVPDISGNADPATGYKMRVDGVDTICGGTSAVAPLWAGFFALINEGLGHSAGFANTLLYSIISATPAALRNITVGDNDTTGQLGAYKAQPGWDPCTGLGAPADGGLILNALKSP